ncbi:uncharacterized protein LOC107041029 [Diachasma alloeum]|nr:uncharacterized protein LOC107041029 [Diachasma alloeum]
MGGWIVTTLGIVLGIVIVVTLVLYRRYCIGWPWGARNIWSVCEEWRQRLSWLWAPREEKVGLVKAQYPTAQTIPGLYRQSGNTSQNLLHSDSDLRLDAQGAFTRFEAVDRDLHPPLSTGSAIPPQPLRPAPQPRPTARPRPSPLQAPTAADHLRMQQAGPGPLTPPPIPRAPGSHRTNGPSVFSFQNEIPKTYSSYKTPNDQPLLHLENRNHTIAENIQMRPYSLQDSYVSRMTRDSAFAPYELPQEASQFRYLGSRTENDPTMNTEDSRSVSSYPGYDFSQKTHHQVRQHIRNDSRGTSSSFNLTNCNNTTQAIMESIYGPQVVTTLLHNTQNYGNEVLRKTETPQNIELTPFRRSTFPDDLAYGLHANTKAQGLQRVSQYIQSLPDLPMYEPMNDQTDDRDESMYSHLEGRVDDGRSVIPSGNELTPSPVPPPAPPDPPNPLNIHRKNEPTTGERIFSALRSVTSQSYIDASEFYNSVLSSAQQVPKLTFPGMTRSSIQLADTNTSNNLQDETGEYYGDVESTALSIDGSRRGSDLYSPELNLKAHQTAQQVYNSLQDPPASPLLLKDLDQEPYPYMSDPSFTRTSEDIFNSLEQRRKSMERLNGIHEFVEMEINDTQRQKNAHDWFAVLEEVHMKRRLSQSIEDAFSCYTGTEIDDGNTGSRRESQGPEPEPPPDEANLKRAISCESVCSDTSVVLGDIEDVTVVGHICVGLEYERWGGRGADIEGDLAASVLEARDLITPDGQPAQDTLVRACLLPDRQTHVQTRLYRGSPSPSYQEKFLFPLDGGPIGRTLLLEIFSVDIGMGGGVSLLGEASLKLGPAARPPATTWLPVVSPAVPVPHLGELMFSLSYLPTAERLTLVVVKARNLRGADAVPGDFFVKVYLLQQGKKVHKKKTSCKRGEKSPTFNEAMIFNVPAHALQTIQLRLTVAESTNDQLANSKAESIGHVIIGATATGKSLAHWRQMLASLRHPVVMWHPLRK